MRVSRKLRHPIGSGRYVLTLLALLSPALWLSYKGYRRQTAGLMWIGLVLALHSVAFFALLSLWGEALWFHELGYAARFWTFLLTQLLALLGDALTSFLGVCLFNTGVRRERPELFPWAELLGAFGGAIQGFKAWDTVLLFLHQVPSGLREPLLERDASFYLFTLPLLDRLHGLLLWIAVVVIVSALGALLLPSSAQDGIRDRSGRDSTRPGTPPLAIASLALGVVVAGGLLLTQGLVYANYHMGDPSVFYNQGDLWMRASEKHYHRVQPVEPY